MSTAFVLDHGPPTSEKRFHQLSFVWGKMRNLMVVRGVDFLELFQNPSFS